MSQELEPNSGKELASHLEDLRGKLKSTIPSAPEAREIVEHLNGEFGYFTDKMVEIDSGQRIVVADGQIIAMDEARPHDFGQKPVYGLQTRGVFRRFDLLERTDQLSSRGGRISYLEPCAVYEETPSLIRKLPRPKLTEMYIPIFRLTNIVEAPAD